MCIRDSPITEQYDIRNVYAITNNVTHKSRSTNSTLTLPIIDAYSCLVAKLKKCPAQNLPTGVLCAHFLRMAKEFEIQK
eukprot:8930009-Ditylum_brightwellii.AAC.1